jgi:outer membrane lipoprotein-sorting protein
MLTALFAFAEAAASESVETIVARHLEAQGGAEKLRSISTLVARSKSYENGKLTATTTVHRARPNMFRYDTEKEGKKLAKGFDGTAGWYVENGEVKDVEPAKLEMMKQKADFDDALLAYQQKGVKVELAGVAEVNGSPAYKLRLTRASGEVEQRYIDRRSMLEVKRTMTYVHDGKKGEKTITFSDYRKVDGVMSNFTVEWEADGKKGKTVYEEIRWGAPVSPEVFRKPAPRS